MDEHAEQNFRNTTSTKPRLWKEEGIQLFLAAKITKAQQIERDADITHSKERHVKNELFAEDNAPCALVY